MKNHLRTDKNCLNCGREVQERYCTHCGQENREPKETIGHLIGHFFSDITHYDSKFFITLKDLLFKPGFLSQEYMAGKRMRYLNPIRMYIFISLVFFIVLFFNKKGHGEETEITPNINVEYSSLIHHKIADSLRQQVTLMKKETVYDTLKANVLTAVAASFDSAGDPSDEESVGIAFGNRGFQFTMVENRYRNLREYDSIQKALPEDQRNSGVLGWLIRTNVGLKSRYGSRSEVVVEENFQHSIPKLMFFLLPLFALFISLFHDRKKYGYTQHAIFSIHFHSFTFLLFMVSLFTMWAVTSSYFDYVLYGIVFLLVLLYLGLALKNNYQQRAWVAFLKAFAIVTLYCASLVVGLFFLAVFIFFTA